MTNRLVPAFTIIGCGLVIGLAVILLSPSTGSKNEFSRLRDTFGDWKVRHVYDEETLRHRFSDAKTYLTVGKDGKLPAQINRTNNGKFEFRFKYGIGAYEDWGVFGIGNWVTKVIIEIEGRKFNFQNEIRLKAHEFIAPVGPDFLWALADAKSPASVHIFVGEISAVTAALPVKGSSAALRWLRALVARPPTSSADLQNGKAAKPDDDQVMSSLVKGTEWKIDVDGDFVTLSLTGITTYGERQRFAFKKGNCDGVIHYFSTYTGEPANFETLIGKVLLIEFNGEKIGAELTDAFKAFSGHMLYFNLGGYGKDVLLRHLAKNQKITIKFVDGDGYKASEYFDVPKNEWSTKGISEAFEKAYRACSQ